VCMKTAQGWQPSSQPIDIGGDELREWGEQWTPTKDTGNGCNTATHAYKLVITPDLLTTLTAGLPTASNHDSGSVKIKVTRTA